MNSPSNTNKAGFTIVELLIVIVVIGILAAITIVAFNGIQQRSRNTARVNEAKDWQKILMSYAALKGVYPVTSGAHCLGTGFPDVSGDGVGDCWDLNNSGSTRSENPTMLTEIRTVATPPNSNRDPVKGATNFSRIGPALEVSGSTYNILYWLDGPSADGCPIGVARWSDSVSRACQISLPAPA